jgi:hypothetical protein
MLKSGRCAFDHVESRIPVVVVYQAAPILDNIDRNAVQARRSDELQIVGLQLPVCKTLQSEFRDMQAAVQIVAMKGLQSARRKLGEYIEYDVGERRQPSQ